MASVETGHCDRDYMYLVQWSLCFKTTQGAMEMWSYIPGGQKIKVQQHTELLLETKLSGLIIKVVLKRSVVKYICTETTVHNGTCTSNFGVNYIMFTQVLCS